MGLGPSSPLPILPQPSQTFSPRICMEFYATLKEKRHVNLVARISSQQWKYA